MTEPGIPPEPPIPPRLQAAQVQLETARWLWESTEDQLDMLIDTTIQRLKGEIGFWDADIDDAAIMQRDQVAAEMQRTARYHAILQAWIIFEDAARWSAAAHARQGRPIGKPRPGESFTAWAQRELAVCADHPLGANLLDWLELLGRLRNLIVHANGQYQQLPPQDQERVAQWLSSGKGVTLRGDRLELASSTVSAAFLAVSMAIFALRNAPDQR